MVDVMDRDPSIALVSCARDITDANGNAVETKCIFPADRKLSGHDVILYNLLVLSNWVGEPSTVMFRSEFSGTGFDTSFFHLGDIDMWFSVLKNGNFYFIADTLASFRRHQSNATDKNLSGLLFALDAVYVGKKHRQILEDFGESQEHYLLRVAEYAAMQVDHLVTKKEPDRRRGVVGLCKWSTDRKNSPEQERKILRCFCRIEFCYDAFANAHTQQTVRC